MLAMILTKCLAFVLQPAVLVSSYKSLYLISQSLIFSHISSLPRFSLVSSKMNRFVTDPSIALPRISSAESFHIVSMSFQMWLVEASSSYSSNST